MCVQGTAFATVRHLEWCRLTPWLSMEGDWDRYRWNNVAALYEALTRVELNLAYSVHTTWVFVSLPYRP
jgi:hypothetical protein